MKRLLSLLLVLCISVFTTACNSTTSIENATENEQQQESNSSEIALSTEIKSTEEQPEVVEEQPEVAKELPEVVEEQIEAPDEQLEVFDKTASLEETVMVDEGGVKITATGLSYNNYSVDLDITIENNSGKDLSFISGSMGYSCNSINGYMINDGYLNCDVVNGKKANDAISFSYDELMLYGINEISDIEIGFDMSDDDYNHTYSGPRQVKTSAFDAHDYSKDCYQETITSRAAMNTYDYEITHFSQDALYDVNGIKLLSSGVMINQDGETALLLELENATNNMVYVSTSNIEINGLIVSSSTWSSDAINPGKRGVVDVEISSVLNSEYWDIYGIKEVGSIALYLSQYDSDWNEIADECRLEIIVPNVAAEFDATGSEVYNNGGLRIALKTLLEDSSEYSSDIYVLLLAENKSGKTITIDDVYDSLSVNGFMTDYSYYSKTLEDGDSAVLEIRLWESSLEGNKIGAVSDVKELEVKMEILEDQTTIDSPVIKLLFE